MFNSVIKSNDQNVVTKLQDNIDMIESRITYMQSVNDYYTKNGTTVGHPEVDNETAKVLDEEGWFHTGDLGYMDKKGRFYITGRCKNVIVTSNGKNIYPEELEYHLGTDIRVGESLVVADENKKGEIVVGARIYPNFEELSERYGKSEEEFTDEELDEIFKDVIDNVNAKLPPFKSILKFKIRRKEFEKTTTSKIIRHKNKD